MDVVHAEEPHPTDAGSGLRAVTFKEKLVPASGSPLTPGEPASDPGTPEAHFSIVVPALNEASYIGECLASLRSQDYSGPIDVVVVDNNSTDDTSAVARSHGASVVFESEPGVCFARQAGTAIAEGDFVVSTDADTTFDRGWLSRIYRRFQDRPELVAVCGPCRFVDAPWWGRLYTILLFGTVHLLYLVTGRVFYASATNIAFRRSAWTGYDTHMTQGGDEFGLLRRLRSQGKIAFDYGNPTYTSSRRLHRGLAYNLCVTCFYYYLTAYVLNRITGRRLMGSAPEIREQGGDLARRAAQVRRHWRPAVSALVVTVFAIFLAMRLGVDIA